MIDARELCEDGPCTITRFAVHCLAEASFCLSEKPLPHYVIANFWISALETEYKGRYLVLGLSTFVSNVSLTRVPSLLSSREIEPYLELCLMEPDLR